MPARRARILLGVLLTACGAAATASAQITGGTPLNLSPGLIQRNNIAYDNVNDVYLVIVQRPPIVGRFLNKSGVPVGPDFQISLEPGDPYVAWVSIAFGGPSNDPTFLVTYVLASAQNPKFARMVRYVPGGAPSVGAPIHIVDVASEWFAAEKAQSVWNGTQWIVGTRVLLPGMTFPTPQVNVLDTNGNVSAPQDLGDAADFYGSPALSCAANGVCFVIGFKAGIPTGYSGGTYGRRFNGATLAPIGDLVVLASGIENQDQGVVYQSHTGKFLVQWFRGGTSFGYIDTRVVGTDGSMTPLDLNRGIGPGAGTNAIAYNVTTQTTLLVTKWTDASLVVMELGDDGYPIDLNNLVLITNWDGSVPDYLPSIGVNPDDGQWLVSATLSAGTVGRVIQGTPATDLVSNGTFGAGLAGWSLFATPTPQDLVASVNNGVLSFYRQVPPPGVPGQGVVFQPLGVGLAADITLTAVFDLGNSSSVRKRITILLHDLDFSDLYVCTFWLAPGAPLRTYRMNTHTSQVWDNATISFYAASAGSNGGAYLLDNVHVYETTGQATDRTECVDPTTPAPTANPDGANLVVNGDFSAGLAPWGTFGQITYQIAGGVFEFYRPPGTPAGVVLQATGVGLPLHTRLTLTLGLGNSSGVLKRVTILVHDNDFSDLTACTFWLVPGQPIGQLTMKLFTTKAWSNTTVSVYAASIGSEQWVQLDNVSLRVTPSAPLTGTECTEAPGGAAQGMRGEIRHSSRDRDRKTSGHTDSAGAVIRPANRPRGIDRTVSAGVPIDLTEPGDALLQFDVRGIQGGTGAIVEVTRDGLTWHRLAVIPASPDWTGVAVDLSEFAGEVVYLRFRGALYDVRDIRIVRIGRRSAHESP